MRGQAGKRVTAKSCSGGSDGKYYLLLKVKDRMWSQIRNDPIPNKKGEQIRNEKQTKFARGSRQHENNLQQQCPFPTSNCDNNHQIIMLIIKFLIVIILVTELLDNISHIRDISNSDWDTIASSMTDFDTITKESLSKTFSAVSWEFYSSSYVGTLPP